MEKTQSPSAGYTVGTNDSEAGVDSRQLLLVGLCLLGLVVAAFLAPVATPLSPFGGDGPGDGQPPESHTGAQPTESGQPTDQEPGTERPGDGAPATDGQAGEVPIKLKPDGEPDGGILGPGAPVPIPNGTAPPVVDGCAVVVDSRPVPGREITVTVYQDLQPAENTRVWFNDDYVGRTDDSGNLTARVPYTEQLNVTVESPANEPCGFYRYAEDADEDTAAAAVAGSTALAGGAGAPDDRRQYVVRGPPRQTTTESDNSTGEYDVYGEVNVTIDGSPYPGSTVLVNATIEGVPMRSANVSVDGERVGRTDESGEYVLTVPDKDSATVTVSRGAYNGSAELDVRQLDVRFSAGDPFVVPGDPVSVTVTRDGRPVENATVDFQDERLGTTAADGVVTFRARAARGPVTASTLRQTAAVPMLRVYAGTVGAAIGIALMALLTTAVTAAVRGRGSAKRVAVGWAAVGGLFVAFAVAERVGLAGAAGVLLLLLLYRYRSTVRSGGATGASWLRGVLDGCRRAALRVVGVLESLVDWVLAASRRVAAWLGSLPRSVSALARRFGGWLKRVPARLLAGLRGLPLRWLGIIAAAAGLVAGATVVGGARGFLAASGVILIGAVASWYRRRDPGTGETTDTSVDTGHDVTAQPESATPTLRELWRRLARWVLPSSWRTSTPTEVSQAAVDRGLPREPVERLTEAFREVEYGGGTASGYRDTVRVAYEALAEAREEDDG